jgi:hypothetical protein
MKYKLNLINNYNKLYPNNTLEDKIYDSKDWNNSPIENRKFKGTPIKELLIRVEKRYNNQAGNTGICNFIARVFGIEYSQIDYFLPEVKDYNFITSETYLITPKHIKIRKHMLNHLISRIK